MPRHSALVSPRRTAGAAPGLLRAAPLAVPLALLCALPACEPDVNCENLCERTLACEVTFAPSDDVEGNKVTAGERSDQASCALGCAENPAVTPDSARCVDAVTDEDADPVTCQAPVAACFDVVLAGDAG